MSRDRTITVTVGIMLSLFMASVEGTVVSTAMPTIIAELGGLHNYSWVFSAYMLASTTTVPIYGKLSDIYGRRSVFAISMVMFLVGSVLSGQSQTMTQLILFRTLQGLGAGGLLPLAFIIIGDVFSFEQRAKMQGLFSSIWGVSAIIGPLLGGFLVDQLSWHWVFYVNVLPGILSLILFWLAWQDTPRPAHSRPAVDIAGVVLLSAGVILLLLGMFDFGSPLAWLFIGSALALFVALLYVERRAPDPVLPLALFRDRVFSTACAHGLMVGAAVFGSASYVPLFVQAVLGTDATRAGAALAPQSLAWVLGSIIGSRLLLHIGYRTLAMTGMISLTIGTFMMAQVDASTSYLHVMGLMAMTGLGMGLSVPSFLIAVQSMVRRQDMGTATATVQFTRSMGGVLGVSIMGAVLTVRLAALLTAAGLDPATVPLEDLIDPLARAGVAIEGAVRHALAGAIDGVFVVAFVAAVIGLAATALAPRGRIAHLVSQRRGEQVTTAAREQQTP